MIHSVAETQIAAGQLTGTYTWEAEAAPAMWKVLRVIWVEGSPMLWPASTPTASPGAASARRNLSSISRANPSGDRGASCSPAANASAAAFFLCKQNEANSVCRQKKCRTRERTACRVSNRTPGDMLPSYMR